MLLRLPPQSGANRMKLPKRWRYGDVGFSFDGKTETAAVCCVLGSPAPARRGRAGVAVYTAAWIGARQSMLDRRKAPGEAIR
jgi:hypothetical protein